MKDATDTQTIEIFPPPKRRGRPRTDQALTNAQRQRLHRQRTAAALADSDTVIIKVNRNLLEIIQLIQQAATHDAERLRRIVMAAHGTDPFTELMTFLAPYK
jgi:hypothetical protein